MNRLADWQNIEKPWAHDSEEKHERQDSRNRCLFDRMSTLHLLQQRWRQHLSQSLASCPRPESMLPFPLSQPPTSSCPVNFIHSIVIHLPNLGLCSLLPSLYGVKRLPVKYPKAKGDPQGNRFLAVLMHHAILFYLIYYSWNTDRKIIHGTSAKLSLSYFLPNLSINFLCD